MPDSILYNDQLGPIAASKLQVTPDGGTVGNLSSFLNGGTVAQTIPAGSTIGTGSTIAAPIITGIAHESITNAITASTTQTVAGALVLTTKWNVVSTVGTAGDAVGLPAAGAGNIGQVVWIINNGASAMSVFAHETSTAIDSHATNVAATLTNAHRAAFVQNTASTWVSCQDVSAAT